MSILEYLTAKNPILCYDLGEGTRSTGMRQLYQSHILRRWDDFSFDSLRSLNGGALINVLSARLPVGRMQFPSIEEYQCDIYDHVTLEYICNIWILGVLKHATSLLSAQLGIRIPDIRWIYHPKIRHDWPLGYKFSTVDVMVVFHDQETHSPSNTPRYPIEMRKSSAWRSEKALESTDEEGRLSFGRLRYLHPVLQILHYCIAINARYGCILSEHEAFIVRVQPTENRPGKCPIQVEYYTKFLI